MRFPFLFRALLFLVVATAAASLACADDSYKIIHTYPHDPRAYTQGLVYIDGHLYESTGLNGRSSLAQWDDRASLYAFFNRRRCRASISVKDLRRGETRCATYVAITVAFVYDRFSFRLLKTLHYDCEGWGLTDDGKNLIESDGTSEIRFFDPENFREVRHITVKDRGQQVTELNELEYIHGQIYANVWHTDRIARISPQLARCWDGSTLPACSHRARSPIPKPC